MPVFRYMVVIEVFNKTMAHFASTLVTVFDNDLGLILEPFQMTLSSQPRALILKWP